MVLGFDDPGDAAREARDVDCLGGPAVPLRLGYLTSWMTASDAVRTFDYLLSWVHVYVNVPCELA